MATRKMTARIGLFAAAVLLTGAVSTWADPLTMLSENFADISALPAAGWVFANNSTPGGSTSWFQGEPAIFDAQAGAADSYIAANFNAADFGGDVSLWLITPELEFGTGVSTVSFWTRVANAGYNDALQLRLSTAGASTDVGSTPASVGVFTAGIVVSLLPDWSNFDATISNPGPPIAGRLAIRYMVTDTSVNGDYVGIDTFEFQSPEPIPEPATFLLLGTGIAGLLRYRRRQS